MVVLVFGDGSLSSETKTRNFSPDYQHYPLSLSASTQESRNLKSSSLNPCPLNLLHNFLLSSPFFPFRQKKKKKGP